MARAKEAVPVRDWPRPSTCIWVVGGPGLDAP
jgi:hypothetical protein